MSEKVVNIKYKRISDFPAASADEVEVFARSKTGANVRVPYDIKQEEGDSTTSLMSQSAVTIAIGRITEKVKAITGSGIAIGRVVTDQTTGDVVVAAEATVADAIETLANRIPSIGRIVADKGGLAVNPEGLIGLNIDEAEGNALYLTPEGKLRSDKKWDTWKSVKL